jgi:DNA-binding GntR family transcriptional regulator
MIADSSYLDFAAEGAIGPRIFEVLRGEIIATSLMPGRALSEKEVAARFGVSRQPVREAFIKLAEVGLLQIVPSRGSFVSRISIRQFLSARFVREAVECALVRAAARAASPEQIALLRASIAEQRSAIAERDHLLFNHLDARFHRTIAQIADCDYATEIIEHARAQTDRVRWLAIPEPIPRDHLIGQHEAISDGIAAGDADGAERAMRIHLRNVLNALPRLKRDQPNLFEHIDLDSGLYVVD